MRTPAVRSRSRHRRFRVALAALAGSIPLLLVTTAYAYGNFVSITPQPVPPGQTLTVDTDSWETNAPLAFYWNGDTTTPIVTGMASGTTSTVAFTVPPEPDGAYDLAACEAAPGPQSGCITTPVHHAVQVAAPVPPPTPPPASPPTPHPTHRPIPRPTAAPTSIPTAVPTAASTPTPVPLAILTTPSATQAPQQIPVAVGKPPSSTPPPSPALLTYNPLSEPRKVVDTQVAAFTLLALGAGGGLAASSVVGGAVAREHGRGRGSSGGKVQSAKVKHVKATAASASAPGDRSWTWRLPGTAWMDAASLAVPMRLAGRSPLLARIVVDGSFLRSMIGSATALVELAGLALGVAAVQSVGGHALPPPATLTIAIAVLGIFDALAGLLAATAFVVGVAVLGGLDSAAAVRTLLGLVGLWTVVPLVAGAARPLRRLPARSLEERWDRGADFVIASLIGAWAVQKIVAGLPGLAGYALPIAHFADAAAIAVLIALVVRMLAESIAARFYPGRLSAVHPESLPRASPLQRLGATAVRTALFVFIAMVVVGPSWQLGVGAALFLVPQVLAVFENRFRNVPSLYRIMPRGLFKLVLMLFFARWFGSLVLGAIHDHHDIAADAFVLLALPGALLSLLDLFGRDGPESPQRWWHRIAGAVILAAGLLLIAGVLG